MNIDVVDMMNDMRLFIVELIKRRLSWAYASVLWEHNWDRQCGFVVESLEWTLPWACVSVHYGHNGCIWEDIMLLGTTAVSVQCIVDAEALVWSGFWLSIVCNYLRRYYAAGSCRWGRIEQCMWMQGYLCEMAFDDRQCVYLEKDIMLLGAIAGGVLNNAFILRKILSCWERGE